MDHCVNTESRKPNPCDKGEACCGLPDHSTGRPKEGTGWPDYRKFVALGALLESLSYNDGNRKITVSNNKSIGRVFDYAYSLAFN